MMSGLELNDWDANNFDNYCSGGIDPTRFQVMVNILSEEGVESENYYSVWSFIV